MKKDWTKDIHDRMGNYEKDAPEGLWNGICEAMPEINNYAQKREKQRKSTVIAWLRNAGVAAAACIVVALALHINNTYDDNPFTAKETNVSKQGYDLYFYKRENPALEMDFFIRDANSLIPIEVKANDGATASLNKLIISDKYPDVKYGIKLGYKNIGFNGRFYTFPYYLTFLLKRFVRERHTME